MDNIAQKWTDVLEVFLSDYSIKSTASVISKKTKLPRASVSRTLNKLVRLNLLNYVREGKNKLFYLDIKKQNTKIVLNILENEHALKFYLKNKKIAIIISELLNYCDSVIIFGSYASKKSDDKSDLDLVVLEGNKKQIKKTINKQTLKINEHYVNYKEFERILKERNPLAIEILKNHVLFGDVSKIVNIFWRREYERR